MVQGRKTKPVRPMTHLSKLWWILPVIFFILLSSRLVWLQLFSGDQWKKWSQNNRELRLTRRAPRGEIFDTLGRKIATNQLQFTLIYDEGDQQKEKIVSLEEAVQWEATSPAQLRQNYSRVYPYGPVLAHLVGYVQTPQTSSDVVQGRTGVERMYNDQLAGEDGLYVYERNALGEATRLLAQQLPQKGEDLHLSVDAELSQLAFDALGEHRGAVVVSEPKTGKILAMVSKPSFWPYPNSDPDDQNSQEDNSERNASGLVAASIKDALQMENNPFLYRPLAAQYSPGSIFKIVTALAGLEYQSFNEQTTVLDEGVLEVGDYKYANWYWRQYGRAEGEVGVVRALARSNDIFFYKAAEWIGPQSLADFARLLGLGQPTGIYLPGEQAGLMPDPRWKQEYFGESWYLGNTYHMGIGQGDVLTTPLQLQVLMSTVAARGRRCQPQITQDSSPVCQELSLQKESLNLVKEGLREACQSGGTAYPFFDASYEVLCKTGTAEYGAANDQGYRRTHAWFTVALSRQARSEELAIDKIDPQLVVTVLVESDEENLYKEGSADAAPVAREIADWWWAKQ